MLKLVTVTKSLGFGAMLGAGILGLLCVSLPHRFPENTSLSFLVLLGALIGAGAHRAIGTLLSPIIYYFKITQLLVLCRARMITQKQKRALIVQLTQDYFAPRQRKQLEEEE